jgi:hypothetical protein
MARADGSLSDRILQALRNGRSDLAMAMALEPLFALWSAIVAAAHHPDPSHPDYQLLIEWRHALVQAIDDVIIASYAGVGIAAGTDGRPAPAAGPLRRYTQWDTGEVLIEDVLDDVADDPVVAAQSALLVFLRPYADLAELAMRDHRYRRKALRIMAAWRQALPQLIGEYCEAAERAMAEGKDPVWACRRIPAWIQREKDALLTRSRAAQAGQKLANTTLTP